MDMVQTDSPLAKHPAIPFYADRYLTQNLTRGLAPEGG